MTTIAWDGETLAADTQRVSGWHREPSPHHKLARGPGILGAAAGNATYGAAFRKWVADGCMGDPPVAKQTESVCDRGIVIAANGEITVYEPDGSFKAEGRFAMGSGHEYAWAAMEAGVGAVRAVQIACKFDVMSGGDVDALTLSDVAQIANAA